MTKKLSYLLANNEITDLVGNEAFHVYDPNEAADGDKNKAGLLSRFGLGVGGWVEIPDGSWSYASSTTITVPSGAASLYAVGDQVRLKQGGGYKYFFVTGVADTTLTVRAGTDYTVANAAITNAAYSKGNGAGFPGVFNYTPTIGYGAGTPPTSASITTATFAIARRVMNLVIDIAITRGAGDVVSTYFTTPFAAANSSGGGGARHNLNGSTPLIAPWYMTSTTTIYIYHGAMTKDGGFQVSLNVPI